MATPAQVKGYLACWFQLGKRVIHADPQGDRVIFPAAVLSLSQFSPEFEACWEEMAAHASRCYLEGTQQTIADLLLDRWQIADCARCRLPIPLLHQGIPDLGSCPCADLTSWPNQGIIPPRIQNDEFKRTVRLERLQEKLATVSFY
ncbi:MAG: hypothetical protein NW237_04915 [Cyanobacteriota bacterium]|nr:hypothetical protein [Cyanobacteriota bacterium]